MVDSNVTDNAEDNRGGSQEDIQIITDAPMPGEAETAGITDYKQIVLDLAAIGGTLGATYSEENQATGEGFVEAIEVLERLNTHILNVSDSELSIKQKDDLKMLITYLRGKLERRAKAVDQNAVNA